MANPQGNGHDDGSTPASTTTTPTAGTSTVFTRAALLASTVGKLFVRGAVLGTKNVLVPLAEEYARPSPNEKIPEDTGTGTFTAREKASLMRAGSKLVYEIGQILVDREPVMTNGVPAAARDPQTGRYPEPSIAYLFSAIKFGATYLDERREKKQLAQQLADNAETQRQMARPPTPVSQLHRRGT
jgi:hypothetical protein